MTEQSARYRRVTVIGSPGAGKTELGMLLARRLGVPFVDLDDEHRGAGWTEPPDDVWRARAQALVEPAEWVMAGHYGGTIGLRAPRCDLVVWLDLPRLLCIWRLTIRSAKIRLGRQVWRLPRDCRAGPDWEPLHDYPAFLRYVWRFRWMVLRVTTAMIDDGRALEFHRARLRGASSARSVRGGVV